MSERVTMPALGESVTEGTVTQWLKSVGDTIEVDEPLLEVSTDKVDTEIPSPAAGTLIEILVDEDETVEVGADLCVIGDADEASSDSSGDDGAAEEPAGEPEPAEEPADEEEPAEEPEPAEAEMTEPSTAKEEPPTKEEVKKQSSGGGGSGGGETVKMPALGESVTEGTVTQWLKAEGDEVEVDEPLLEVSTDKVDTEIPSPVAGTLTKILVDEDETVEVGADLCVIGGDASGAGEQAEPEQAEPEQAEPEQKKPERPEAEPEQKKKEPEPEQDEPEQAEPAQEAPEQEKPKQEDSSTGYVTPLVRKLAAEHDIDLSTLKGTGVGGRIRKQDVLDAAKPAAPAEPEQKAPAAPDVEPEPAQAAPSPSASAPAPSVSAKRGTREKMSRLRQIIAQRMVESLQVAAQLTAVVEVDMTRVATLRARVKDDFLAREGVKLNYLPFIALATVEALKEYPQVNCAIDGKEIVYPEAEHLGVAVDTPRGLLVPVIKDAGDLNIAGIARKIADLAERTRTNQVTPDELGGGTFTITNIGSNGSLLDTPIINVPQSAILGTGVIVKRPVVVDDDLGNESIAIRSMCYLVLTYDHRVVDGAEAGRFLTTVKKRLEAGAFEV